LHTLELENPDLHASLLQVSSFTIDSLGDLDILDGHAGQIGYRNLVVTPPTGLSTRKYLTEFQHAIPADGPSLNRLKHLSPALALGQTVHDHDISSRGGGTVTSPRE